MSVTKEVAIGWLGEFGRGLPAPGTVDVTIEVMGIELGDQVEAERLLWHALVYDPANRTLEVSVERRDAPAVVGLRHEISDPRSVWVEEDAGVVKAIAIEDGEGVRTIITFHEHPGLGRGG